MNFAGQVLHGLRTGGETANTAEGQERRDEADDARAQRQQRELVEHVGVAEGNGDDRTQAVWSPKGGTARNDKR